MSIWWTWGSQESDEFFDKEQLRRYQLHLASITMQWSSDNTDIHNKKIKKEKFCYCGQFLIAAASLPQRQQQLLQKRCLQEGNSAQAHKTMHSTRSLPGTTN
jgi:hypothetical protein